MDDPIRSHHTLTITRSENCDKTQNLAQRRQRETSHPTERKKAAGNMPAACRVKNDLRNGNAAAARIG
jgi:hypothetical protein